MGMIQAPSVVIDIIDIPHIAAGKTENYPPVGANSHGPKAFELTLERMQPETGHVHVRNRTGSIEPRENVAARDVGASPSIS